MKLKKIIPVIMLSAAVLSGCAGKEAVKDETVNTEQTETVQDVTAGDAEAADAETEEAADTEEAKAEEDTNEPTKEQKKDPFMFKDELGKESPYAMDFIENGEEEEMTFEDGTHVEKDDDRILVEFKGNIYGRDAQYIAYCDSEGIITAINAGVPFETTADEAEYYHALVDDADAAYGAPEVFEEGTMKEYVAYTVTIDGEENESTLYMSRELAGDLDNPINFVNIAVAKG